MLFVSNLTLIIRNVVMIKNWVWIFCIVMLYSCSKKDRNYPYTLQAVDSFLSYNLDSDVKIPLSIRSFMNNEGKEYLYFQNGVSPELLIYDIQNENLVKRTVFEVEGQHAIKGGFLNGFMITDFNQIYIAGLASRELYETDTTGYIKQIRSYAETVEGYKPVCCFKDNGTFQFIDGKLYLPQSLNWQLGEDVIRESVLLCCIDTLAGDVNILPFKFPFDDKSIIRGTSASIKSEYKYCYDGRHFVYSFAYMDKLMVVNPLTSEVEYKSAKSQYAGHIASPSFQDIDNETLQRKICEYPAYGNIMYDSYNKVYYRVVYVPQEIDRDINPISLIRSGRKQFSIIILDEQFNVIGEHLFPPYMYNPKLCFITGGKLYISTSHIMNPNYSDDILEFQMIELVKSNCSKK